MIDKASNIAEAEGQRVPVAQLRENVIAALRTIFDPEIPVNIYDLGLIYVLDVDEDGKVSIRMTLTAPACPVAETFPGTVESRLYSVPGPAVDARQALGGSQAPARLVVMTPSPPPLSRKRA